MPFPFDLHQTLVGMYAAAIFKVNLLENFWLKRVYMRNWDSHVVRNYQKGTFFSTVTKLLHKYLSTYYTISHSQRSFMWSLFENTGLSHVLYKAGEKKMSIVAKNSINIKIVVSKGKLTYLYPGPGHSDIHRSLYTSICTFIYNISTFFFSCVFLF